MRKPSQSQSRSQLQKFDPLPMLNEKAFASARDRYRERWKGEEARIELILEGIRDHKDWTVYLGDFNHAKVSFSRLPFIEEMENGIRTVQNTKYPMDLRGIPLFEVNLSGCYLTGVSFQYATLHGVDFSNSRIETDASFYGAHILRCNFNKSQMGRTRWGHSVISSSDFSDANLFAALFVEMTIRYSNFTGADLDDATFQEVEFYRTRLSGVRITKSTNLGVRGKWQIFESRSDLMKTERLVRDGELYDFPSKHSAYAHAAQIYRELKLAAKKDSLYDLAGTFYFRERKCDRLALHSHRMSPAGAWLLFQEMLLGYGEKPFRVLVAALVIICLFSLLFLFNGFEYSTVAGRQIVDRDLVFCASELRGTLQDLSFSIYMSIVTFSTLGYGDAHPLGITRWLASTEALLGVVLMALFVATIARVIIRD